MRAPRLEKVSVRRITELLHECTLCVHFHIYTNHVTIACVLAIWRAAQAISLCKH